MPVDTTFRGIEYFESTFRHQIQPDGEIKARKFVFDKKFGTNPDEWPVEANRYRLIWMPGCPHAHKVVITWKLLGLDRVISLGTTGILRTELGWVFSEDPGEVDPVLKVHYLHDIYTRTDPEFTGRSTVPILVDTVTGKAVNNDHYWIPIYFNTAWKEFHKENAPDLYPEELRPDIDRLNRFIFERVNEGFYKCGFARSQRAYNRGYEQLFEALDILDRHLEDKRFLFGDYITDSDIRLYPSLVRFHQAYHQVFRANRNRLTEFKNLWPYARDLYQTEGFRETTHFDLIKKHYQTSPHLRPLWGNVNGIYTKGPETGVWEEPHHREALSKDDSKFLIRG
jgi:putative glutathione S-transferase